jgi:hypothetical protein
VLGVREPGDRQTVRGERGGTADAHTGQAGQDLAIRAGQQDRDLVLDRCHVDE